jgi:membrane protein
MTHPLNRRLNLRSFFRIVVDAGKEWNKEDPWRHSAIIAFYAIFALPALVIIAITIAGFFLGEDAVEGQIARQISGMIGKDAANQIEILIANTHMRDQGLLDILIGFGTLLFGATTMFVNLQISLNEILGVEKDPEAGIIKLLLDRILSLGVILMMGFLLLISLVLTSLLAIFSDLIINYIPDFILPIMFILNFVLAFLMNMLLFSLIFKILPDAKISWVSVLNGAAISALLFEIGKFLLSIYFGEAEPGSIFGAAGSIILILLWVSYNSLILFYGIHFAKVFSWYLGYKIKPNENARWNAKFKEEHKNLAR